MWFKRFSGFSVKTGALQSDTQFSTQHLQSLVSPPTPEHVLVIIATTEGGDAIIYKLE